jgi:hypothetical protein
MAENQNERLTLKEKGIYEKLLKELVSDYYYSVINYYIGDTYTSIDDVIYNNDYKNIFEPILESHSKISKQPGQYIVNNYLKENELWILVIIVSKLKGSEITLEQYNGKLRKSDEFKPESESFYLEDLDNTNLVRLKYLFEHLVEAAIKTSQDMYFYTIRPSVYNSGYDGSLTLASQKKLDPITIQRFSVFFSGVFSSYIVNKAITESIKSTKAAIMSRNMSHNLGSHVMTYLKHKLSSVENIVEQQALIDLVPAKQKLWDVAKITEEIGKNMELPFLVGLGRFINYLQERQDYIATVATDYISAKTTISFKDFIYDELKLDLRYERHHKDYDKSIVGKKPQNILLDYIAYSEGYTNEKITIKFGDFDGTAPNDEIKKDSLKKLREFEVALPGGTIGRQAFFSIMENIIRNAAKHGGNSNGNNGNNMEIVIDVVKDAAELDKVDSNITDEDTRKQLQITCDNINTGLYDKCKNKYDIITITVNKKNPVNTITKLRGAIKSGYIGKDKDNNKGIKEMRISAAWMRGYTIDDDINLEDEPPALAVRGVNYEKGKCFIQYVICLPKPRKIAFVINDIIGDKDALNESIDEYGWKMFFGDNKEIADYEMIVMSKELSPDIKQTIRQYAHGRIYEAENDDISRNGIENICKKIKGTENDEEKENKVLSEYYNKWISQTFDIAMDRFPWIIVCDDKTKREQETKEKKYNPYRAVCTDTTSEISDYIAKDKSIVFTTHYKGVFEGDKKYKIPGAGFIEGVSGANSTDRLIRRNDWTSIWYYKHVLAALTKVAIIDERIYNYVVPPRNDNEEYPDKTRMQEFYEKGIYIFNLSFVETGGDKIIKIMGYNLNIADKLSDDFTNAKITEVGKMEKNGSNFGIEMKINTNAFHFLLIHQSLLDRIYDWWDLETKEQKIDFTNELHKVYYKKRKTEEINYSDYNNTLPRFIIHSGRSKPNSQDMPQHQPFLQFSAVENAVKDCKYTLSELLYSAHYEKNSDNY